MNDAGHAPDLRSRGSNPRFGVLGPLEVRTRAGSVHAGGPQIRTLLALLLSRPGHVLSMSTLIGSLWPDDPPPSAERTTRTYMSRLRQALQPLAPIGGESLLVLRPPGYLLRTEPLSVDAYRFEQYALAGRRALNRNDPMTARAYLCDALELWRGDAYGEFSDVPLLRAEASRLEELRLSTVENRLQAELSLGLGAELVAEMDSLVATHPLRERLWVQLMIALYRSGRQAEALSAYQRARTLLADELGLEPSAELVETHGRILAQDPTLLPLKPLVVPPVIVPSSMAPAQTAPARTAPALTAPARAASASVSTARVSTAPASTAPISTTSRVAPSEPPAADPGSKRLIGRWTESAWLAGVSDWT